ncbi:MAG: hypothetical protein RL557_441 [archaeon]|jgi:hypothetical protein
MITENRSCEELVSQLSIDLNRELPQLGLSVPRLASSAIDTGKIFLHFSQKEGIKNNGIPMIQELVASDDKIREVVYGLARLYNLEVEAGHSLTHGIAHQGPGYFTFKQRVTQ